MLKVKRLHPDAKLPTRGHPTDAGLDLYSIESVWVGGKTTRIRTGLAVAIPEGHVGLILDRSSLARDGFITSGGVIDHGFTGEIILLLTCTTRYEGRSISPGDKVAQLVIVPVAMLEPVEVDDLPTSQRGDKGFGSTGR